MVAKKAQKRTTLTKAGKHKKPAKAQKQSKPARAQKRDPLLFISHKHENSNIAEVLRRFIRINTSGNVVVFVSSSGQAVGPRAGFDLKQELRNALWNAGAFVMIYTHPKLDWSYCTYEYGVANNPNSPDTRMILLQCGDAVPDLFMGQVNINLRDAGDVQKFVNQLLTDPTFFPNYGGPVTRHESNGETVATLAANLFEDLKGVLPAINTPADKEWPVHPFLQLQLDLKHVKTIWGTPAAADRVKVACELIREEGTLSATDNLTPIFGAGPGMDKDTKFEELVKAWAEGDDKRDSHSEWVEALCRQIMRCIVGGFTPSWKLMMGEGRNDWYAPMLTRVRRVSDQYMQFDIYFFKFKVDERQRRVKIEIPEKVSVPGGSRPEGDSDADVTPK